MVDCYARLRGTDRRSNDNRDIHDDNFDDNYAVRRHARRLLLRRHWRMDVFRHDGVCVPRLVVSEQAILPWGKLQHRSLRGGNHNDGNDGDDDHGHHEHNDHAAALRRQLQVGLGCGNRRMDLGRRQLLGNNNDHFDDHYWPSNFHHNHHNHQHDNDQLRACR